ncbi:MAG: dihydrodipicolinate synthase family protein [Gemmatimonas sp.]|uniref:dihydrodipicolinate synthase family protein n=1 Tax=Gemmatimonas sp. TaxID=1962908 RepID=UPI00391F8FA2|nr:dihydrodipicolinate synthase family protein [Gemmatimonadota bacterium]
MTPSTLGGLMVPAVTTFTASGDLDGAAFQRNLDAHLAFGMDGILVAGSSGESALLDDADRRQLLEWARARVPTDKWLLAGIGSESTRQTIARAHDAKAAGADAVLVISPHYFLKRMTAPALLAHFRAVADASPLPVLLYNMPAYTHIVLSPAFVHEMALHENVVGMKDSAGNIPVLQQYLAAQNASFRVLTGSGGTVVPALEAGASGAILAIALFAGPAVRRMVDTYRAGEHAAAAAMQQVLTPLATDIAGALGPAGMKAAMSLVGLHGGPPRSPLLPVEGEELAIVKARLEAAGLL